MSIDRISSQVDEIYRDTKDISVNLAKVQVTLELTSEQMKKYENFNNIRAEKHQNSFETFRVYVLVFGSVISAVLVFESPVFRTILKALFL